MSIFQKYKNFLYLKLEIASAIPASNDEKTHKQFSRTDCYSTALKLVHLNLVDPKTLRDEFGNGTILKETLKMINQARMIFADFSVNSEPISL